MNLAWNLDPYHPRSDPVKKKRSSRRHNYNWRERLMREYDDGLIICSYCGRKLSARKTNGDRSPNATTIDHVIPLSVGGANSFANVVLSCFDCNGRKGNSLRTPEYGPRKGLKGKKK